LICTAYCGIVVFTDIVMSLGDIFAHVSPGHWIDLGETWQRDGGKSDTIKFSAVSPQGPGEGG